jgi:predicted RNA-binding Zn-ribbon protein involved in translation (DUF1610 family)
MSGAATMTCPKCGARMNRHAEKLVYPESTVEARRVDPGLGGLIEETFGCPNCGNVEARRQ